MQASTQLVPDTSVISMLGVTQDGEVCRLQSCHEPSGHQLCHTRYRHWLEAKVFHQALDLRRALKREPLYVARSCLCRCAGLAVWQQPCAPCMGLWSRARDKRDRQEGTIPFVSRWELPPVEEDGDEPKHTRHGDEPEHTLHSFSGRVPLYVASE